MNVDYLIVGSGLTGAVIARTLADAGREVLVVDRRTHLGGNVHDHTHESGIRIHTYGPHYFRTADERIWEFVTRFSPFYRYEAALKSWVDGQYENWPVAASYIRRTVGDDWQPEFTGKPGNFEEASLAMMPRLVYEKFVRGYTEKQWGVPARTLSAALARRFDVRQDDEPRLMRHKYQGLPTLGYHQLMTNLLAGIAVKLNVDYLQSRSDYHARKLLVFTGPIDEFYQYELGRLHYRGQRRTHEYLPNVAWAQPAGQVNNPDPAQGAHIRTLEWKHMLAPDQAEGIRGTVLTREVTVSPSQPNDYEYPFPDEPNAQFYQQYSARAAADEKTLICGRLGEYRYYDMDQAIGRALKLAENVLSAQA